ncbi:4-hydroxy-tetrahydrodipicolinate synthase [Leptolyngbya sp. 7M]|uniref:4-hydroxy-tetrahydrodipicolinate synthase n=1 Tax=Leptolyngbya sp. 7M TaxID=2812896 RepID=UPI001B8B5534|nr:4-hydroxy-tetrahydrodipicolinate synthase [Leptolyngbya sp. 7M]QYO65335.1 4-hydroxy-tetrahydrodipicolinate synthase [Leptolyngbya sp. 7M]
MTMRVDWMSGVGTALVTPFLRDGSVDRECFRHLAERQIKGGVKILVPCGTTGESVTMSEAERLHLIRMTVEVAHKLGAKVIAGTGSNNTAATIDFTRKAREAGADAALIVAPYYNKPTQEGLFAHFGEIAKSVKGFPIMLYNVPGRTASNISAETTLRLADKHENIVATKEASGNLSQVMEILAKRPKNFKVFSGDDATAVPFISLGGDGLVSVVSNEMPKETEAAMGLDNILSSQSLWDATMAYWVADSLKRNKGSLVVHLNGGFHTEQRLGTVEHLQKYKPDARILVVTMRYEKDFMSFDAQKHKGLGDFVILTDSTQPRSAR